MPIYENETWENAHQSVGPCGATQERYCKLPEGYELCPGHKCILTVKHSNDTWTCGATVGLPKPPDRMDNASAEDLFGIS